MGSGKIIEAQGGSSDFLILKDACKIFEIFELPPPVTGLYYKIHATSLISSVFGGPPSPPDGADII